jgi:hypothetical protein
MKNSTFSNLLLLFLSCLLFSCHKQHLEDAIKCQSIAYVIEKKDVKGNFVATDTSICWPQVCGEELARFKALNKEPEPLCGRPGSYMVLVIWSPGSTTKLP